MSSKSSNNNTKNKQKNDYAHKLINDLQQLNTGGLEEVDVNLEKVSINQALKLIQQNVQNKKLAFVLEDNKYYFLNDHTINKLMKGLVDENAIVQYKDQVKGPIQQTKDSDAEWVEYFDSVKTLKLIIVKAKTDKTKPGGGFFKYYHTTKYDLRRFAVYKEDDDPDYAENCLVTALREGGLSDDKIQMVKLFVMNRIIPKCKLKEVCEKMIFLFR